jgi:NADH-quinone oxidoreductase subunit L
MTFPLQVLALLSIVGGLLIGFPGQLFHLEGWSFIDRFMEPVVVSHGEHAHHVGLALEWGLVALSVAVAAIGIWVAYRMYKVDADFAGAKALAGRFPLLYKLLLNKYWVDEIYDATVVAGTIKLARFLWEFDARVVDGLVNGTALSTVGSSFVSGIFDLRVVDGAVNLVAWLYDVASRWFRRLQVGFAQGYAMVMVFGAAVLLGIFYVLKMN